MSNLNRPKLFNRIALLLETFITDVVEDQTTGAHEKSKIYRPSHPWMSDYQQLTVLPFQAFPVTPFYTFCANPFFGRV